MSFEQVDQELTEKVHRTVDIALVKVNIVLAVMMLLYGIVQIYVMFNYDRVSVSTFIGCILMILCAGLILVDRDRNLLRSTGLMAVGNGCFRIFKYITDIHPHDTASILPMIYVILGCNLIYSGSRYMRGITRGRIMMMLSMIAIVILNSSMILMMMMFGESWLDTLISMPEYVVMTVMYVMFIGVLDSDQLRSHDILEIHNRDLDGVRQMETQPEGYGISEEVASILSKTFTDRSSWIANKDEGPVECQYDFTIGKEEDLTNVIVQKWKDSDIMHFTVCDHIGGTIIHAYRFHADSVFLDGNDIETSDRITFVGNGRVYSMKINHHEEEESYATC